MKNLKKVGNVLLVVGVILCGAFALGASCTFGSMVAIDVTDDIVDGLR